MQAVHRYAVANNPYMGKKFNPKEEMSYLQYLDATVSMDGQCHNRF